MCGMRKLVWVTLVKPGSVTGLRVGQARAFLQYCVVGLLNTLSTYAVYSVLVSWHCLPSFSLGVGYSIGMVLSYLINSRWTFREGWAWGLLWRFLILNSVVLSVAEGSLWLLLHLVTESSYLAQAINTVLNVFAGFFVNRYFVFSQRNHRTEEELEQC